MQKLLERLRPLGQKVRPLLERVRPLIDRALQAWRDLRPVIRRRIQVGAGFVVLLLLIVVIVGGGDDDEDVDLAKSAPTFRPAFEPTARDVIERVTQLGAGLQEAIAAAQAGTISPGTASDLSADASEAIVELDGVKAPASAADEVSRLLDALAPIDNSLNKLSVSADRGPPENVQEAAQALARDAPAVARANAALKALVGS